MAWPFEFYDDAVKLIYDSDSFFLIFASRYSFEFPFLSLQRYIRNNSEADRSLFDLIMRMLEFDPTSRITLDQALQHVFFTAEEESQQPDALASKRTSQKNNNILSVLC